MASTSQYSTWPIITVSSDTAKPAPSPALNFVAAAASARLQHYDIGSLGIGNMDNIRKMDERMIGKGGFAVVELGKTIENDLVAVKRLRVSARNIQTDFESHLRHICLEARVLCHEPLRTHRNIVDILGYCLSSIAGYEIPFLALVLEYSSEGSLKHFLKNTGRDLPFEIVMDLAAQVADGLVALHQCKICHGDVKTQNALVFKDEEAWIVKISDFGQSIVGQIDECSVPVDCGPGTPLLHAPEIRNGILHAGDHFTIDDAIRTDIFSFGLLIWEILKRGESYFDRSWCVEMTKSTELDQMETYLEKLPHNGLLAKACDYIQKSLISPERKKILLPIFQKSLQDDSHKRSSMQEIRAHFERQIDTMS
jgi:serine/threonine protein kinase